MAAEKVFSWSTLSYFVGGRISLNYKVLPATVSAIPSLPHPICSIFSQVEVGAPFFNRCGIGVWPFDYFTAVSQVA